MTKSRLPKDNNFFRQSSQTIIWILFGTILSSVLFTGVLLWQVHNQRLPDYVAVAQNGRQIGLIAHDEPNLLASTILTWASKAAVTAYTFDFVNYQEQAATARAYFTDTGWIDYQDSVSRLLETISRNQLFVNGVVSGTPVIQNQGELPGQPYYWRVQLPFTVTYQSSDTVRRENFMVTMKIVRVPTWINSQGIGVEQFVMT